MNLLYLFLGLILMGLVFIIVMLWEILDFTALLIDEGYFDKNQEEEPNEQL